MSIYHVWARFNLYSFEDELTIFDRWQVPPIEYDAIVTAYKKEFFKCDLSDNFSETSYLVVLKKQGGSVVFLGSRPPFFVKN